MSNEGDEGDKQITDIYFSNRSNSVSARASQTEYSRKRVLTSLICLKFSFVPLPLLLSETDDPIQENLFSSGKHQPGVAASRSRNVRCMMTKPILCYRTNVRLCSFTQAKSGCLFSFFKMLKVDIEAKDVDHINAILTMF